MPAAVHVFAGAEDSLSNNSTVIEEYRVDTGGSVCAPYYICVGSEIEVPTRLGGDVYTALRMDAWYNG